MRRHADDVDVCGQQASSKRHHLRLGAGEDEA